MHPISSIEDLTPDLLTKILSKNGFLTGQQVINIKTEPAYENTANVAYRIKVAYDDPVPDPLSDRLYLKLFEPDLLFNANEVFFYSQIVPEMQQKFELLPFPPCYDAAFDPVRQQAHVLLKDLSASHKQALGPIPPSNQQCEAMVEALALFHAFWWEHPKLGSGYGEIRGVQNIQTMVESASRRSGQFLRFMGDRYTPERQAAIQKICSKWPEKRYHRYTNGIGITLVHRDAHPYNFLFPKNRERDRIILTDWQSWRVDTGTDDLAYMMAAHWYPDRRKRLEIPLLEHYYGQLLKHGVEAYSWENCLYDYKASVIRVIFILAGGWRKRRDPNLYFDRLEKCLIAFEDLDCEEIL